MSRSSRHYLPGQRLLSHVTKKLHHSLASSPAPASGAAIANCNLQATGLSTLQWGRRFLSAYFTRRPSLMHRWLDAQLAVLDRQRGQKLNVVGPRGGAKSTIGTLCYVLRVAVEAREPYVWIVSDTKDQAHLHLDNVKRELEDNALLAEAYPGVVGAGPQWRAGAIELNNGVMIEAYGTGQPLRGRRYRENRPSLIVCDDLQNDSHTASASQRESSRHWFEGTLLKAGNQRTNLVNLATALHRDALAMQLDRTPGWTSRVFRAIVAWPEEMQLWRQWETIYCDAEAAKPQAEAEAFYQEHRVAMDRGAELLWPHEESLYALMRMRVEEGHSAFEREKQSSPIDPTRCEFPEDYFGDHLWFDDWPAELQRKTIALDPSKGGDARHGDYSAFVMLGVDACGALYVEADLARRPTPKIVADGVRLCQRFQPDGIGIEGNQFQDLLAGEFATAFAKETLTPPKISAIHNHTNKHVRIRRLGPYLSQRRLRFRRGCRSTQLVVDQLRDFPLAAHDDGPDALEMAIRLAEHLHHHGKRDDGLGDRLPVG